MTEANNRILVTEVTDKKEMDDFVHLPRRLYTNISQYVPDLDSDIRDMFNPKKNPSMAYADMQAFVAYRNGIAVGRVAGIISHKSNDVWHKKAVRFSLIEFIDDIKVSRALINAVEQWGRQRGMTAIQGPMGITDFDKEGMLVEDFELSGTFMEYWNPPYYKHHMERLGMKKEADWLQIRIKVPEEVPAKYARVASLSKEMFGLRMVQKTKKEVYKGYGQRIFELLNQAYAPLFGFAPFSSRQVKDFLKRYLPLLNMKMIALVENEKEELVCAAITVNDFSEGLKKSKGKVFPKGWFHLLKALKWKKGDKAELMIIGVRPDMQGLGINALVFDYLIPVYNKMGIKWCETGPQLETNVKELSQWKPLNPELVKRRRCWVRKIKP
ncbi:MAG: N-acetyltransferase [Prevotellaceae bacterium]|nr:N-acetyltransferase [Prevotellaceae bacterium]MDO4932722.1 N-acetyltransferase [Prevotellaceae bacterium]